MLLLRQLYLFVTFFSGAFAFPLLCDVNSSDCIGLSHIYNSMTFANQSNLPWKNRTTVCSRKYITCNTRGNVVILDLHNLGLTGIIPPEINMLKELESLYLFSNELYGRLPNEIGSLKYLKDLMVSENLFEGPLPVDIGNLSRLTYLGFSYNKLTGQLPSSIGNRILR